MTADTNVAIYSRAAEEKSPQARATLAACSFLSVQVLNEFASVSRRKLGKSWQEIGEGLADLREAVPDIREIRADHNEHAVRLASRYQLPLYDAVLIAVALQNGATTLFTEDMQHGLVIDDTLRIENPFL